MIYLDNAATTYPKPDLIYTRLDYLNRNLSFNAGRGSYTKAQETAKMIEQARIDISNVVNASTTVFSVSATMAMNQIINGLNFDEQSVVYFSPYEHNAVMRTLHKLAKSIGFKMIEMPIDSITLAIDVDALNIMFMKNPPTAIFCIHVSNVTGYVLPIEEIGKLSKANNSIYVVDAAQSFAMIPIDMVKMNIDYIVFAGHKTLYGPLGVGGFCCNTSYKLKTFYTGGTGSDSLNLEMPSEYITSLEPSSQNSVAIISLIDSVRWIKENRDLIEKENQLHLYLVDELKKLDNIVMYICDANKYFSVLSFNVKGYDSDDVGLILDKDFNICVRSGYHCTPNIHKHLNIQQYKGTVRVGLGLFNSVSDIDELIKALKEL